MTLWALLVLYQLKHFVSDFPLQGSYMLGKFKGGTAWILPLLAHASVHGAFTALIVVAAKRPDLLWLALFDLGVHFCVDRVKASPELGGRWSTLSKSEFPAVAQAASSKIECNETRAARKKLRGNKYFWWALGADQAAHHLTHYFIIYKLMYS